MTTYTNDLSTDPSITASSNINTSYNYFEYDATNDRINYKAQRSGGSSSNYRLASWADLGIEIDGDFTLQFDYQVTTNNKGSYAATFTVGLNAGAPNENEVLGGTNGNSIVVVFNNDTRNVTYMGVKAGSIESGSWGTSSSEWEDFMEENDSATYKVVLEKSGTDINVTIYNSSETEVGYSETTITSTLSAMTFSDLVSYAQGGNVTSPYHIGWIDNIVITYSGGTVSVDNALLFGNNF